MSSHLDRRARYELAHFGEAIGDPSRAAILVALLGGVTRPASELARAAGVAPSTATSHLQHLVRAGLLVVRERGRHRYYEIAGEHVAHAIESVGALHPRPRARAGADPLAAARVCYTHLAGRLAVTLWARAKQARWIEWSETGIHLLPEGLDALAARRLVLDPASRSGRACLDWTERVPHVSGPLGVAVCDALFAAGWVRRAPDSRALRVTARGLEGLDALGVRRHAWA
ncbi:Transcriptional regulator, ArsR family protein [Minicystis rosea]|nr:Transcriptional regulator, ArsR family protein [Minicystis rosea]